MIGVFDSGLGGLTVVRAIRRQLPGYDIVYLGDTARTPYGSKSLDTVARYARQNAAFLLSQASRLIVVACNTASSISDVAALGDGRVPVFDVIEPAVRKALNATRTRAIGVIGTRATIASGVYERRLKALDAAVRVVSTPCPLLVPLVEEGWAGHPVTRMIVKRYLLPIKTRQIDTLILGCTHYPVLKSIIQRKIGPRVAVIDSSETVAASLKAYLSTHPQLDATLSQDGRLRICVSDETEMTATLAGKILDMPVTLERIDLPN
ncbi:MAG: glutamate racemase [Pseudomonadota bacterium]